MVEMIGDVLFVVVNISGFTGKRVEVDTRTLSGIGESSRDAEIWKFRINNWFRREDNIVRVLMKKEAEMNVLISLKRKYWRENQKGNKLRQLKCLIIESKRDRFYGNLVCFAIVHFAIWCWLTMISVSSSCSSSSMMVQVITEKKQSYKAVNKVYGLSYYLYLERSPRRLRYNMSKNPIRV
ncbi:hypothetical protein H8356DRAFT_1431814 [Neocallimastix lanati (nom. inval.)]|nr:hypothetical protein H8356DRAFT_1431814 [Neocallimastix sp. JGI-2020a]